MPGKCEKSVSPDSRQMFPEHLLCAKCSRRCWRHSGEREKALALLGLVSYRARINTWTGRWRTNEREKGSENYRRLCDRGEHSEAAPSEQILELTNKARPRAGSRAFQMEGNASAKAQRPHQM